MKLFFYPRLALDGIRKNKRMYLPYILTCIGMVMMYYIIVFLCRGEAVKAVRGASVVREFLRLGSGVIAFFAGIFLFYTNSFLIRRRKKEFGLYNILGMGKRNIGILLLWETLFIAVFSLGIGLGAGMLFSKLAELGLIRVLRGEVDYSLSISGEAIGDAGKVFGVIFFLLFLNALFQVHFTSAISLVHSENVGEKPPRANWLLGIVGVALLGGGYYIAVTADNPVYAMLYFFCGSDSGHRGDLSFDDSGFGGVLPNPSKAKELLLQSGAFCVGVIHGVSHEAERGGTGVHLYSGYNGIGDAVFHNEPVFWQ